MLKIRDKLSENTASVIVKMPNTIKKLFRFNQGHEEWILQGITLPIIGSSTVP